MKRYGVAANVGLVDHGAVRDAGYRLLSPEDGRQIEEALMLAATAMERASFDAHDREWSRTIRPILWEALALLRGENP